MEKMNLQNFIKVTKKELDNFSFFGIDNNRDQNRLEEIKRDLEAIRNHAPKQVDALLIQVEDIQERQWSLEEERASLGCGWW